MRCAYIQRRQPIMTARIVTVGQLVLFSTEPAMPGCSNPATARGKAGSDGESEPIHIEETDTTFAIVGKGANRIDGPAFVTPITIPAGFATILGYPTDKLSQIA